MSMFGVLLGENMPSFLRVSKAAPFLLTEPCQNAVYRTWAVTPSKRMPPEKAQSRCFQITRQVYTLSGKIGPGRVPISRCQMQELAFNNCR